MLKDGHVLTITAIYVFTLIVVITFAIEIGQKITNTGNMEFADILFGITGFVVMYACFAIVVVILKFIFGLFGKLIKKDED